MIGLLLGRRGVSRGVFLGGALVASLSACGPETGARPTATSAATRAATADLVFRGGTVVTNDPARPRVSAVAVRGDRIVFAGDDAAAAALIGPRTRIVELGGRTVLPALTDAHGHLSSYGASLAEIDLRDCTSADDCASRTKGAGAGERFILGFGWDQNRFPDKKFPTHEALDRARSDRPIWLRRIDGHAGWANARALAVAHVTKDTKDPPGGHIERGPDGAPTGVLIDEAMTLVDQNVQAPAREELEAMILRAEENVLAQGITEVHEMGLDEDTIAAYRALAARGALHVRVYAFARAGGLRAAVNAAELDRVLGQPPDDKASHALFKLRGVKLFADGALGSRGAALLAPYKDDPENRGTVVTPEEVIEHAASVARKRGWQVAVHAIGDRGNRMVLDAFEHAGCTAAQDLRFRIEHAQIVALSDIPRFRALGVIASMQPTHATSDMPWAEARLGSERLAGAYAWRRFLDAGVRVIGGSDFPVERLDAVAGLYAAVTRMDAQGRPPGGWLPDQRMTVEQAISAFTADAAYGAFEETWRGRAAPGFAADLTVLDRDILADPPRALHDARPVLTMVAGKVVFERDRPNRP